MSPSRYFLLPLATILAISLAPASSYATRTGSCGNGTVNSGEECDDGDNTPGDGCGIECTVQDGWTCSGSPSDCTPPASTCGDGVIDATEMCDDGNRENGDGCDLNCFVAPGFICTGEPSSCAAGSNVAECGNGALTSGEECDDGNETTADGCSDCQIDEGWGCTGVPSVCGQTGGGVSACGNGIVEVGESCDGEACCDEDCTFSSSSTTCRASVAGCDAAERCSGSSATCPSDSVKASASVCRASTGGCDPAETCDGSTNACPADTLAGGGTVCRPAVNSACDVQETCAGTGAACPADVLVGCPDVDGIDCVIPACDVSGQCTTADVCNEICRGANFWARRGTTGPDSQSVIDSVLDEVGSLQVCGQTIDSSTELGDLDSAIEALCVQTRGIEERELFRALVTTELNCAISEGGTCDQITDRFMDVSLDDCDALCAGTPVPGGPTAEECIDQLECFNEGGVVVEGDCATGTCENDPSRLCGEDFDSCEGVVAALDDDDEGDDEDGFDDDGCEDFDGNCADARLCDSSTNADVQICGKTRPTNNRTCRDARKNDCTIDDCD